MIANVREAGADAGANRRIFIALGLFLLALPFAAANRGWLFRLLILPWLGVSVLILLDALGVAVGAALPAWLQRPRLTLVAAGLYGLMGALLANFSLTTALWVGGLVLFLREGLRRGELGPFDPRQLRHGARLALLVGAVLAAFTFSLKWDGGSRTAGYFYNFSGYYYSTYVPGIRWSGANAHGKGAATLPALLLFGGLVWASWRGNGATPTPWFRFVPLGLAGALFLFGFVAIILNIRSAWYVAGGGGKEAAIGPFLFPLALLPFGAGALLLALRAAPPDLAPAAGPSLGNVPAGRAVAPAPSPIPPHGADARAAVAVRPAPAPAPPAPAVGATPPTVAPLRLVITAGAGAGTALPLEDGATIGRSAARARFVVGDQEVSGLHARVERAGGLPILVDARSTNGTFVNGERVLRRPLRPGDRVRLGNTEFVVQP